MSYIAIPEELLEVNISAAQFRALIHIIKNTYSSGKYAGCCCLGYRILADKCFTDKSAIIKTIRQLEGLGFIEIDKREKFNRSNALRLTLENGLKRCRSGMAVPERGSFYGCQNTTDNGCQNTTDNGCQNTTQGCLKTTLGCQNTTPHKDLNFKNLNLKTKTRAQAYEDGCLKPTDTDAESPEKRKTEPDDVASGRTMPDGDADTVAKNSAKEVQAAPTQTKLEDFCLVSAFFEVFPELQSWVNISRIGGYIGLQPIGKIAEKRINIAGGMIREWFEHKGVNLVFIPSTQVLKGQILNLNGRIA